MSCGFEFWKLALAEYKVGMYLKFLLFKKFLDSRQIIEKPKVEMSNIDAFPKYLRDNLLEMGGFE